MKGDPQDLKNLEYELDRVKEHNPRALEQNPDLAQKHEDYAKAVRARYDKVTDAGQAKDR